VDQKEIGMDVYARLKDEIESAAKSQELLLASVTVRGRPLLPEEAIGTPEHSDYPLIKGREQMLEVEVGGNIGHAFTDGAGRFSGAVEDVLRLDTDTAFGRAVVVATLNAVLRGAGLIEGTIHCRDDGPVKCAPKLPKAVERVFGKRAGDGDPKRKLRVALVGLQPRMAEALAVPFEIRITDLDPDNIGTERVGVKVEGPDRTRVNLRWCDIAVVTGTVLTGGAIEDILDVEVPVLFYGVTIAGASRVMDLQRFCPFPS
jgi:hypothetical protein